MADDVLEMELLACAMSAIVWEDPSSASELLDDIDAGAPLLAALAVLGPPVLQQDAAARAPADDRFGRARAHTAFFADGPDDLTEVRLEGDDRCLTVFLRAGAVAGIVLDDPATGDEPLALEEAAKRLRRALSATPALDRDAAVMLPLLEHFATGAVGCFPRPPVDGDDVFGEEDVELLAEAFGRWLGDGPFRADAEEVAASMLGFKLDQGVSEPVLWLPEDVGEFLAEYAPWVTDTLGIPPRTIGRAAMDFLRYLEKEGLGGPAAGPAAVAEDWLAALPAPQHRTAGAPKRRQKQRRAAKAARKRNRR